MTRAKAAPKTKTELIKRILILLVVLAGGGWLIRTYLLSSPVIKPLELSGRIEGYETDIGAKVGGKLLYITVREGDKVKKGQILAQLEDTEIKAQLEGAKAKIEANQEKERQANWQIEVIKSQIEEVQLARQQSEDDSTGRTNQAFSTVTAAEAQLAVAQAQQTQAQSELKLAKADLKRYHTLLKEGVVSQQQYDQILSRWETSAANLKSHQAAIDAASKQIQVTQGALIQATSSKFNSNINQAKLLSLQTQLKQTESQLNGAKAEVRNSQASEREIRSRAKDLKIYSPLDGVVITRTSEPGQVLAAGKTVLTVVNLGDLYLRGYIPEGEIGRVRVGQQAEVYLDSSPKEPIPAKVTEIDSKASFTPENIYFKEDRVKQVFGVKLGLTTGNGYAKPGMPADAKILEPPQKP